MNLENLFETQKLLDNRIVDEHNLHGQDLLPKKILSLQVELGELVNELPEIFKFWSHKKNNYEKALEEYVDCLHFILSIGNDLSLTNVSIKNLEGEFKDMLECFRHCNNWVANLDYLLHETSCYTSTIEKVYGNLISIFIDLGEMLGFTPEKIEQSYYQKNAINHTRQDNKY